MRLIDADAFELNVQGEWEQNEISNSDWILFRELLKEEPTIDAVEVVRCGQCKYGEYREWGNKIKHNGYFCQHKHRVSIIAMREDDFCNYGEREGE